MLGAAGDALAVATAPAETPVRQPNANAAATRELRIFMIIPFGYWCFEFVFVLLRDAKRKLHEMLRIAKHACIYTLMAFDRTESGEAQETHLLNKRELVMDIPAIEQSASRDSSALIADSIPVVGERPTFPNTPDTASPYLRPMPIGTSVEPLSVSFATKAPLPESPILDACVAAASSGLSPQQLLDLAKVGIFGYQCKKK